MHLTPRQAREGHAGATWVPVVGALTTAEIEELRWIDPRQLSAVEQRDPELAPLLYDCVRMWPHTA